MHKSILLASLLAITATSPSRATEPSILLEGNGGSIEYSLSTRNRVYFNADYMAIGSSKNTSMQPVTWAYSTYNIIRITPTQSSVKGINADNTLLRYNAHGLKLTADVPETFNCVIYDTTGSAVVSDSFDSEGNMTVYNLPEGIYFATATNGAERHTLKFIIR